MLNYMQIHDTASIIAKTQRGILEPIIQHSSKPQSQLFTEYIWVPYTKKSEFLDVVN